MMRERFTPTGILFAFIGGAAAGAAAALLLAPKSGEATRRQIKDFASHTGDKVSRMPRALKDAYAQASEKAKDAFTTAYEAASEGAHH